MAIIGDPQHRMTLGLNSDPTPLTFVNAATNFERVTVNVVEFADPFTGERLTITEDAWNGMDNPRVIEVKVTPR